MGCIVQENGKRNGWSILIKPTHDCNFNCKYCYDEPYRKKYRGTVMSMQTLNEILLKASKFTNKLDLIWHGGEPLIVGKKWYKDAQEVIAMYPELEVQQSMQSNGSLLDPEWADLLNRYNIDIGISFDGPYQSVRNKNYTKLEDTIKHFYGAGGESGFICVINQENYEHMIEIYEYFKTNLKSGVSFNRIFETGEALKNELQIGARDFRDKYKEFYRYWLYDTDGAVEERTSNEFTKHLFGLGSDICVYGDCTGRWLGFNPLGDIYPCDRYIPDEYSPGNIREFDSIEEVYESEPYKMYKESNTERILTECAKCDYFKTCGSGCTANHLTTAGHGKCSTDECDTYKMTFVDVYDVWRDVDIYKDQINSMVGEYIIKDIIFTPLEIKNALKNIDSTIELEYDPDVDKFMGCSEMEVYRIVNPYAKLSCDGHIDIMTKEMSISIYNDDPNKFLIIEGDRNKLLTEILTRNIDKIREMGGVND